ncbi:hypothetical protein NA57DRAFT_76845 [Rhizodiscina lignyota]|uniref:Transmembrane protein n=1 Tax=Rhizodiscina lignyota TaxID=1504668 RepID=A0A9P4IEW1_9PEZI|nr:hypothetical protein NA57DRAFT_76845 [Rhizodiscina lignyota]
MIIPTSNFTNVDEVTGTSLTGTPLTPTAIDANAASRTPTTDSSSGSSISAAGFVGIAAAIFCVVVLAVMGLCWCAGGRQGKKKTKSHHEAHERLANAIHSNQAIEMLNTRDRAQGKAPPVQQPQRVYRNRGQPDATFSQIHVNVVPPRLPLKVKPKNPLKAAPQAPPKAASRARPKAAPRDPSNAEPQVPQQAGQWNPRAFAGNWHEEALRHPSGLPEPRRYSGNMI